MEDNDDEECCRTETGNTNGYVWGGSARLVSYRNCRFQYCCCDTVVVGGGWLWLGVNDAVGTSPSLGPYGSSCTVSLLLLSSSMLFGEWDDTI